MSFRRGNSALKGHSTWSRFTVRAALGPVLALVVAASCTDEPVDPFDTSADPSALPILLDQNPDPTIVEVTLVAGAGRSEFLAGKPVDVFAYRDGGRPDAVGSVPGPVLEAKVGDRVIVHYRNELAVETTVHWHGVRLPNASDGTPSSQIPVAPGTAFTYEFVAHDSGTFWYHPHMQADVLIERGLYGVVRVVDDIEPSAAADRVFVLDDVKVTAEGQFSQETQPLDVMLGRQGNVVLINGRQNPRMTVRAGTRERWRFVNTANGRFFNLKLGDRPFFVIGWDGGLLPRPYVTNTLLIAPGERYEVLVPFSQEDSGGHMVLQTVHYDRGHDIPDPGPIDLLQLRVEPNLGPEPELPFAWAVWSPLPVSAETPHRTFELREEEGVGFPKFFINDQAFPNHVPIEGVENAVEVWEIRNKTEMDHPFHLHGMFFQVLDVNGVPPAHLGQKDTVNVPQRSTLRFAVRYGGAGHWMYHCHILEHAERGMMGELRIGHTADPLHPAQP
jgi:FtsP/CotA-like multicopper oxidase with cupredoxin domain